MEDGRRLMTIDTYLRALSPEQRDRVIEQPEFAAGGNGGIPCLIECAEPGTSWSEAPVCESSGMDQLAVAIDFDHLLRHYDEVFIVWLKRRCAALNDSTARDIAALTAEKVGA